MNQINISNEHPTNLAVSHGTIIHYDDFIIQTMVNQKGKKILKVLTDKGFVRIRPQTGNSFIVESEKE